MVPVGGESVSAVRREQERVQTRERILGAAVELLLAEGVDGFSMRKLAQRIGYTPTAIYLYFPDKETLLGEVVETQFVHFRQALESMGRTEDPILRLRNMGLAFVRFGLQHPDHYRFMFLTPLNSIPKGRIVEKGNPSQDCYAFLVATVAEGLAAGRFRPELTDAHQLAQMFFSAVHGVVALHIVKGEDDWVEWRPVTEKVHRMLDALLRGLTAAAEDFSQLPVPPEFSELSVERPCSDAADQETRI
ncbi:MAG: TetR/AcrR family transcriptional regulator [Pirellulales bacterium]